MRNVRFKFAVIVAVAAGLLVAAPTAAQAAGGCNYDGLTKHIGYLLDNQAHPGLAYEGSSTYMTPRPGAFCSGVGGITNFQNNYAMLASVTPTTFDGYAQAGYEQNLAAATPGLRWFAQYYATCTNCYQTKYAPNDDSSQYGVQHTFRVVFDSASGTEKMNVDTTNFLTTNFNPFGASVWLNYPWSPQFTGEAYTKNNDIAGTAAVPATYRSMGVQDVNTGALIALPCIMTGKDDSAARWTYHALDCQNYNSWTYNP